MVLAAKKIKYLWNTFIAGEYLVRRKEIGAEVTAGSGG